jgi:hypothetical protein
MGKRQTRPGWDQQVLEARRYACACSVVVDGRGNGTGFLVGKDLVITNYHVVVDDVGNLRHPSLIQCRFGFYEAGEYNDGRQNWVPLASDRAGAIPATSGTAPGDRSLSLEGADYRDAATGLDLYDYAILRLARPVGQAPGRSVLGEMDPLGWIAMDPNYPLPLIGQPLSLVEFPERIGAGTHGFQQEASSFADGNMGGLIGGGVRVRHDAATRKGASGSGVFDFKSGLIGLHNAGKEFPDKTADNRFIPIIRILGDIKRQSAALYEEITGSSPPSLAISGLSTRMLSVVEERVNRAKIVLDRDLEHGSILVAVGPRAVKPVQVNHIIGNDQLDAIKLFIERLALSAAHLEGRNVAEVTMEYLRGQSGKPSSFEPWTVHGIRWPDPTVPAAKARTDFENQLTSWSFGPRTLLAIWVDDIDQRDPAEELEYMQLLGEVLSGYSVGDGAGRSPKQMLQAIVVYQSFPDVAVNLAQFAPLWTAQTAPQNCGVSLLFPKVKRNDVEPWVALVNTAWSLAEGISIPDAFRPRDRLSMKEVFGLLEKTIADAATAFAEKTFGDKW